MLGWHFTDETECLRYGDGRKIKVGITHKVNCEPILCQAGLHTSKTVLDALQYAPGNILFRVRLSGKIVLRYSRSVFIPNAPMWPILMPKKSCAILLGNAPWRLFICGMHHKL